MVEVPDETPVTTPEEFMVATAMLLLLQTPPDGLLDRVVVLPAQTLVVPVIGETTGKAFTVTVTADDVAIQPLALVTSTVIELLPIGKPVVL